VPRRSQPWVFLAVLAATEGQLAVAVLFPHLEQFEGKAFTARLIAYPVMILAAPAWWFLKNRARTADAPWAAFSLIALPFLVDVTGNTLDLYDTIEWWDDANHLVNWVFLMAGVGLLMLRSVRGPRWASWWLIAGVGSLLALGWEVGEYYAFIRGGTELATAYTDTLGDMVLGTIGAAIAATMLTVTAADRSGSVRA